MSRTQPLRLLTLLFAVCSLLFPLLTAAAPLPTDSPNDLIRQANTAFARGDAEAATKLYAAAEERTADPGLVAFNKAAVLFGRGEFRDAEVHYARVLEDKACPPDRAAKAWFNRGTCLLRRGGSVNVYRTSIACFERCLDMDPADTTLTADAQHNLELAKLLWAEANKKAAQPKNPNDPPPPDERSDDRLPPQGGPDQQSGLSEQGLGNEGSHVPQPISQQAQVSKFGGTPNPTNHQTAGPNASLEAIKDQDQVQQWSAEETREYLRQTDERLQRQRRDLLRALSSPDRVGVRDW
jgi:tetratricopeptide (TPR) repeat protein